MKKQTKQLPAKHLNQFAFEELYVDDGKGRFTKLIVKTTRRVFVRPPQEQTFQGSTHDI